MKLYLIAPVLPANCDRDATDARLRACIEPIADTILSSISADVGLFVIGHENEFSNSPVQPDTLLGNAQVVRLADKEALRRVLVQSGDPFSGRWMFIRSLVTCRFVYYGYDGQAFVCLITSDPPIVSPDESLITVGECSHLLTETDLFDVLD